MDGVGRFVALDGKGIRKRLIFVSIEKISKLGLGTAQWGMVYGSFNRTGMPSLKALKCLLEIARIRGVRLIDTAVMYGKSEEIIGKCLENSGSIEIVTKTPYFESDKTPGKLLLESFEISLNLLKQRSLYGLLIHRASDLLGDRGLLLYEALQLLKQENKVIKIGVSVYTPEEAEIITSNYDIDLIQIPINILDQRFLRSGTLLRLKKRNIEIHARSVFLQGLLLQSPEDVPTYFSPVRGFLKTLREKACERQISPAQIALEFLLCIPEIDKIIVGVETVEQFEEILSGFGREMLPLDYSEFASSNERILNPNLWPKGINS